MGGHLMIFEPESAGHRTFFFRLLLKWLHEHRPQIRVTLAIQEDLARALEEDPSCRAALLDDRVAEVVPVSESIARACAQPRLLARSRAYWKTVLELLEHSGATHLHSLHMDPLQLPLALRKAVPRGVTLSGLLFRPTVHYTDLGSPPLGLKERVRSWQKAVTLRRMLGHPSLRFVLSLDEAFVAFARERLPFGRKCQVLADPCLFPVVADAPPPVPGRVCFVLFGSLARRKGIYRSLEALRMLSPEVARRMAVVFAGKLVDQDRDPFMREAGALEGNTPAVVEVRDRYISDEELASLLGGADAVLAPYQRFVGSSGVLLQAAGAGKPVITQDYGLVGHHARRYGLGIVTDTTDPRALARAMEQVVEAQGAGRLMEPDGARRFVENSTPERFAGTFFREVISAMEEDGKQ